MASVAAPFTEQRQQLDVVYTLPLSSHHLSKTGTIVPTLQMWTLRPRGFTASKQWRPSHPPGTKVGASFSFQAAFCSRPLGLSEHSQAYNEVACQQGRRRAASRAHWSSRHFCEQCKCSWGTEDSSYMEKDQESFWICALETEPESKSFYRTTCLTIINMPLDPRH